MNRILETWRHDKQCDWCVATLRRWNVEVKATKPWFIESKVEPIRRTCIVRRVSVAIRLIPYETQFFLAARTAAYVIRLNAYVETENDDIECVYGVYARRTCIAGDVFLDMKIAKCETNRQRRRLFRFHCLTFILQWQSLSIGPYRFYPAQETKIDISRSLCDVHLFRSLEWMAGARRVTTLFWFVSQTNSHSYSWRSI